MANEDPAPGGIDGTRPNVARMHDYLLGGRNNFAADRYATDKLVAIAPDLRWRVHLNREFLGRAVRFLARSGIRQFIAIGAGLPTQGNVHEVAAETTSEARVVYVDNDPVVLVHAGAVLKHTRRADVIQADLRDPEKIVQHLGTSALIDFDEPVALVLVAILHSVPDDDDPAGIVARFRDAMSPGSYVALSHETPGNPLPVDTSVPGPYRRLMASVVARSAAEVGRFFDGFDLVDPGLVDVRRWGADGPDRPTDTVVYGGVGRKP